MRFLTLVSPLFWGMLLGVMCIFAFVILLALGFSLPTKNPTDLKEGARCVRILGSQIRFRQVDRGTPTIILLHSFGSSLEIWNSLTMHLDCGRIISLDLIGFGGSERPRVAYDLETHRRHLLTFMDALNVNTAVLVGSSMGASIAAWTAAHTPDRVQALILFAPSGYPGSLRHRWPYRVLYKPGIPNSLAHLFVKNWLFDKLFPNSLAQQALGVTGSYDSSFADALAKIHQPTLLIWSRGDKRVPFSFSEFYLDLIPNAILLERPDSVGHGADKFAPEDTASSICTFLMFCLTNKLNKY